MRFALTDYTEKEYNNFGWARVAEALTKNELDDLYSKIQEKPTLRTFKKSSKGEAIIEVNKKPDTTLDVNNTFVFVKGTRNNFEITRVIKFDAETETEMEIIKERLYERRTFSDTHLAFLKQQGFATEYTRESAKSFGEYQKLRESGTTSRGTNQSNRKSSKYGGGRSFVFGENGEVTETRFALTDADIDEIFGDIGSDFDFDIEAILDKGAPVKSIAVFQKSFLHFFAAP